jgi:hypothetical protein
VQYKGEVLIVCLHQLPGIIWSVGLGLQLSPTVRFRQPWLHHGSGIAMAASSVPMAVGAVIIAAKDAAAEDGTFAAAGGSTVAAYVAAAGLACLSGWWVLTAAILVKYGFASRKAQLDSASGMHGLAVLQRLHRLWALRHVAAGAWVIVQRWLVMLATGLANLGKIMPESVPLDVKGRVFMGATWVAIATTVGGMELLLLWLQGKSALASQGSKRHATRKKE